MQGEAVGAMKRMELARRAAASIVLAGIFLAGSGCKHGSLPPNHGFPEASEVSDWSRTQEVRTFAATDLWKYDDGDAEKYIQAGVQSASTAEYKAKDQIEVVADIYTMSNTAGAKTIFESEPAGDAKSAGVGDASRLYKQNLTFRTGAYLVRIVAFQESPQSEQELVELGKGIERKLAH